MQASSCPCVGGGVSDLTGMGKMDIVKSDTITFHGGPNEQKVILFCHIGQAIQSHMSY
jgi:hypothetical protein